MHPADQLCNGFTQSSREKRAKSALVEQMCEESRELARCGIRERHPDYELDEVEHALHRLWVGDALADKAWPNFAHLRP